MYNKGIVFQCTHCKKTRHQVEFDRDHRPDLPTGMFDLKKVWGMYFGLFAFAALIALSFLSAFINSFL